MRAAREKMWELAPVCCAMCTRGMRSKKPRLSDNWWSPSRRARTKARHWAASQRIARCAGYLQRPSAARSER
eukprot:3537604-Pyramimonas_sp.AAC.1